MPDQEAWEKGNGEFLSASIAWLRGRLTDAEPAPQSPLAVALGAGDKPDPIADAERISPPPALVNLATTFGLTRFERDTLLLCSAAELDPSITAAFATAQGNPTMTYPTFALALATLPDPAWEVVSAQQGLRFWQLVEIARAPGQPLITSALRADERIVNVLKGLNYLDERLAPLVRQLDADLSIDLPPSQEELAERIAGRWQDSGAAIPVMQLAGRDGADKALVAAHAASRCGLVAYRMSATLLPTDPTELDTLARLWQRESLLLPIALYLDLGDAGAEPNSATVRFLDRLRCPTFLAVRESVPGLAASEIVDVTAPTVAERATAWSSALPAPTDQAFVSSLATQFALDLPAVHRIAAGAPDDVWTACRARTRPALDTLAKRIEPRVDWSDLVLPDEQLATLHQIADQVAQRGTVYGDWGFAERITRGLGVSVLLTGPPGTGKNLCGEVLANHLKLDLYRIDLSAVVSKYIGETEKNLRALFDAAEGGGAILFFDEADALFGKRSDVKEALDRFANTQTNDLLQRMDEYSGLSILATNMRRAMDGAFLRRLRFVVEVPFPETAQRHAIWQHAFPAAAPVDELDFDRLATLRVTGGMARNIAMNAAFTASAAGRHIAMPDVLAAARMEFVKMELPLRERDFAWAGDT
jgi:hypothetical protein